MTTVVLVGAKTPQRTKFEEIIHALEGLRLRAAVDDVEELFALLWAERPDILLLDLTEEIHSALELNSFFQQFPVLRPQYVISYSGKNVAAFLLRVDMALEILMPPQDAVFTGITSSGMFREQCAADFLFALGIPACSKGYRYLMCALSLVEQRPEELTMLTKSLYVQVARTFHAQPKSVEKTMRDTVQRAFARGNRALWQSLFYGLIGERGPVLGEFLAVMHRCLERERLERGRMERGRMEHE